MWKLKTEHVATFIYSLVCKQLSICRNTHILLLFEQKPNPEVCANVNASRSCTFSNCRGGLPSFMAPVVAKASSETLISHSISHVWQKLRMVPALKAPVSKVWERSHPDPQNLLAGPNLILHQGYKARSSYQICEFLTRLTLQTVKHQMFSASLRKASVWLSPTSRQHCKLTGECQSFYSRYPSVQLSGCCTSSGAKISLSLSSRVDLSLVHV